MPFQQGGIFQGAILAPTIGMVDQTRQEGRLTVRAIRRDCKTKSFVILSLIA
jgi:hypothetical protein